MSDRLTVDTITSDQLDAMYEQLEAAEETEAQRELATAREALASATARAARAEEVVSSLRMAISDLCREPHPGHDHVCPSDVRKIFSMCGGYDVHYAGVVARAEASAPPYQCAHGHTWKPFEPCSQCLAERENPHVPEPVDAVLDPARPTIKYRVCRRCTRSVYEPWHRASLLALDSLPGCGCTYGQRCPNCRD